MSEHLPPERRLHNKDAIMNEIFDTVSTRTTKRHRRNVWIAAVAGVSILALGIGVGYALPLLTKKPVPADTPTPTASSSGAPSSSPSTSSTPSTTPAPKWTTAKVGLDLGGVFIVNGEQSAWDRNEAWLIGQLGTPDEKTTSATCAIPGSTAVSQLNNTVLRWGDLRVTISNQVIPGPGGDFPAGSAMGWQVDSRLDGKAGASPDGRFANGVGVGSTLAELKAAWPDGSGSGATFDVFQGDTSNMQASLVDGKVVEMNAGRVCAPKG